MIPTHGRGPLGRFLLGSVTANVLHHCGCPVWTGAHLEDGKADKLEIRKILCAVDFGPHSADTVSWAVSLAAEFGSRLTLGHVTPGLEIYGPGGKYVESDLKEALVGAASQKMAKLSKELGVNADVKIASGDVPKVLRRLAEQTKADLIVIGGRPSEGYLRIARSCDECLGTSYLRIVLKLWLVFSPSSKTGRPARSSSLPMKQIPNITVVRNETTVGSDAHHSEPLGVRIS